LDTDWEVNGYFNNKYLSSRLNNALFKADEYSNSEKGEGRLLVVPFYQLVSLWVHIEDGSDFFIIITSTVLDGRTQLEYSSEVLTSELFISRLRELSMIPGRIKIDESNEDFLNI